MPYQRQGTFSRLAFQIQSPTLVFTVYLSVLQIPFWMGMPILLIKLQFCLRNQQYLSLVWYNYHIITKVFCDFFWHLIYFQVTKRTCNPYLWHTHTTCMSAYNEIKSFIKDFGNFRNEMKPLEILKLRESLKKEKHTYNLYLKKHIKEFIKYKLKLFIKYTL